MPIKPHTRRPAEFVIVFQCSRLYLPQAATSASLMFTELTKGADVHTPTITPEMISAAVTQSAAGMDGVQKEALDKFGQALTEFLQSTLDHAQEKQNADPEQ